MMESVCTTSIGSSFPPAAYTAPPRSRRCAATEATMVAGLITLRFVSPVRTLNMEHLLRSGDGRGAGGVRRAPSEAGARRPCAVVRPLLGMSSSVFRAVLFHRGNERSSAVLTTAGRMAAMTLDVRQRWTSLLLGPCSQRHQILVAVRSGPLWTFGSAPHQSSDI